MKQVILWDCLEEMDKLIEQWIKVDAIITDPPYWTTACKWDSVIPFDAMWERLNKLIKPNWAIVLFGSEPFSSALRMSNIKNYKYDWIWNKKAFSNQMMAKKQPLRVVENIIVFNSKIYQPQGLVEVNKVTKQGSKITDNIGGGTRKKSYIQTHTNYPRNILEFSKDRPSNHPTQKPVALMEYLIKTYTNEWEIVLDFTAWSWSTLVAAQNTNRNYIWIEKEEKYYNIINDRLKQNENKQEKETNL